MNTPKIMGILNLTPDSFSDGGQYLEPEKAQERIQKMIAQGATIIDIGAESSGPNSTDVSEEEEWRRLAPILQTHTQTANLSIDTYKAGIADKALTLGAKYINDITAFRGDPAMAKTIAKHKATAIIMYSKDTSARTTIKDQEYEDIIQAISDFFTERLQYAEEQGLNPDKIILDPGMGHFVSSIPKYSFEIIERLPELRANFPKNKFLIGLSRKSFLGGEIAERDQRAKEPTQLAIRNGVSIIRAHDVKLTKKYWDELH